MDVSSFFSKALSDTGLLGTRPLPAAWWRHSPELVARSPHAARSVKATANDSVSGAKGYVEQPTLEEAAYTFK
jgi:hypothetical protein